MNLRPDRSLKLAFEVRQVVSTFDRAFHAFMSGQGEVAVADRKLQVMRRLEAPVGSAALDVHPGGELLAFASEDEFAVTDLRGRTVFAEPWRAGGGQRSAVDLEVVEQTVLIWQRWPIRGRWTLWAGAGQDGTWTWFVSLDGAQLRARPVEVLAGRSAAPPAIHPGGRELVAGGSQGRKR